MKKSDVEELKLDELWEGKGSVNHHPMILIERQV